MITYLPKYMREVLGFEIFDVGIFSSIPYLVMWIVSLSSGFLSDYLISHGILSITFVRKLFTCGQQIFILDIFNYKKFISYEEMKKNFLGEMFYF